MTSSTADPALTAVYADFLSNYALTTTADSHGFVTGFAAVTDTNAASLGDEGTDTLTSVERLVFQNADGPGGGNGDTVLDLSNPVQLFDSGNHLLGTFATIQAAINAAGDGVGQYILAAAGTYAENLVIDRGVEIRGVNAGVAGDGTRGAETILTGQSQITTSPGGDQRRRIPRQCDYTLDIADNCALKVLAGSADGHVVENSVFDRAPVTIPADLPPLPMSARRRSRPIAASRLPRLLWVPR